MAPGGVIAVEHGGHGCGHRPEVDGDVLGLHDHLAPGGEQRRRGIAPLLDVGRVGRPDEHRTHLLAGGVQRACEDLELDRIHHAPQLDGSVFIDAA